MVNHSTLPRSLTASTFENEREEVTYLRKTYSAPSLTVYGRARDLTLGSSGPQADFIFSNGQLTVNDPPDCTTNGPVACITIR